MESTNYIDTGQSESTEDKEAVCDERDLITESIETLETSDTMGQKDRALHSNSDLSEGNLSDGKTDLYEIDSKCDGSPKKLKRNKERRLSESKIKEVEKDVALKGAESNVAMGTDTDKSQAKKEKRKRDRKKRKQNKKDRAGSMTEGGEEKENNLHKVDSSETDISEKDEIVKVKEKSESKPKKENGKKRKNSVAKKGEKCSDMNENNLESGDQIISLTDSKSQELSSDSEQLRSDSTNSGNEEVYDMGKESSDTKVKDDSEKQEEKLPRSSSPSKKKKKKKKLKNIQSVDEADDKETLNLTLEISQSPKSKQSPSDTATNGNNNLTSAEQKSPQEQIAELQSHSNEVREDNPKPQTVEEKQNTTEQTNENSKMAEPQTSKESTSDVVAMKTNDEVTEVTSEPVAKENSDEVTEVTSEPVAKDNSDEVTEVTSELVAKENSDEVTEVTSEPVAKENSDEVTEVTSEPVAKENSDEVTEVTSEPVAKDNSDEVTEVTSEPVAKENSDEVTEVSTNATTDIKELLSEIKDVLSEFPADGCRESSVDPEDHITSQNTHSESANLKPDVSDMEDSQLETNSSKEISSEETKTAQSNNSTPNSEVQVEHETGPQNCSETVEDLKKVTECSKDTANQDVLVEKRSDNLETQSEISAKKTKKSRRSENVDKKPVSSTERTEKSENLAEKPKTSAEKSEILTENSDQKTDIVDKETETATERTENLVENSAEKPETSIEISKISVETSENLIEQSQTSTAKPSCKKSESDTPETPNTLCKDNVATNSATDNSQTLNCEVKDILSNMVDNVDKNSKPEDVPKVAKSVVPDHVDLSDIEDASVDSIGSEDLPQSKKCDSEIHVPLNPSKLRDELVKLESENLSVIADLEKDASLLEESQLSEQQTDVSASQSKEDNSPRVSKSQEADTEDVVDSMNSIRPSSNEQIESSFDCVDGLTTVVPELSKAKVMDAAKSDLKTKPVISVQDVGVETEADEEKIQMREEIERLKEELNSTKDALQKSKSQVYRQQIHSSLNISTLQAQLHKKNMEMKQAQLRHDHQIEAVISRLFLLEGEIRREQKQILGLLELKETVIDRQSQKMEELIDTNDKLSMALKLHNIGTNGLITPLNRSTGDLSPTNKASFKEKESPKNMKLRWGTMKDKLRRHKSSFELHHPDRMETLEEGTFRYGSQENLSASKRVIDRKERCRSYAEYPQSLRNSPLVESPNENEYQKSDASETTSLNMAEAEINDGQCSPSSSSDDNSIISDISSVAMRRGSIKSLPNGVGMISANRGSSPNIYKDVCELSPHEKPVKQSSPSSNHHESNPFKSIKTMLKRRGSKLRSKKRSSTDPQANDSEQKEAMKNHFKKYEMQ